MSAAVNLTFSKSQKESLSTKLPILTKVVSALAPNKNADNVKISGIRLGFSASQFFELSSNEDILILWNKICDHAEDNGVKFLVIEDRLEEFITGNETIKIVKQSSAINIQEEFFYIYQNALIGLPYIADEIEKGHHIISWEKISIDLIDFIPSHSWINAEKNIFHRLY